MNRTQRLVAKALIASIACAVFITGLPPTAGVAKGAEDSEEPGRHSIHDYVFRIRPGGWFVYVEGEYETKTSSGRNVSVSIDGDLGYDDPYPTFAGVASLRWNRHDFWVSGAYFDQSEDNPVDVQFTIGDRVFNIGGTVESDASVVDVNFRYGYSFFDFEEDGFRLGPTIAVGYMDLKVKVTELTVAGIQTGTEVSYEEALPVPTLGGHLEVPLGNFLLSSQAGAFYANASGFEAVGIRGEAGVTWRPHKHVGLFAGVNLIYADVDLGHEEIDDLLLIGPSVGLEFRY
jgi:hypothetical protein